MNSLSKFNVKDSQLLSEALRSAAQRGVSKNDEKEQRISFVSSSLSGSNSATKAKIREVLAHSLD
jgi:hypothetical protein